MKLAYTGLILLLAFVLLRELWAIWLDDRVFIGKFDVVTTSGSSDADSKLFPTQIVASQKMLVNQITDYQAQRSIDQAADVTFILPGMTPLNIPPASLPGMDLTYQGVNFTSLFTNLRKTFLARGEITGSVTSRGGSIQAAVDWPDAPGLAGNSAGTLHTFLTPPQSSLQDAADQIACTISHATAASKDPKVAAWPTAQFCNWAGALGDYYSFAMKASTADGLGAAEVAQVRRRAAQLRRHYGDSAVFAEIYRLRADLLDLLPEASRSQVELVDAQEDRIRYAMLSKALAALSPEDKRFAALALARPAIPLVPAWDRRIPENWAALLTPRTAAIDTAAASTALLLRADGQAISTGAVVAPGVLITTKFGLLPVADRPVTACFGRDQAHCDVSLALGDVLYDGTDDNSRVALVRLVGPDARLLTPLPVAETLAKPNELSGRYAMVIGYPFRDARMPAEFINRLLGVPGGNPAGGERRLMPGRILAFGPREGPGQLEGVPPQAEFTTDISSSGGSGGAPLIDIMTGRVIGMHYAGMWRGERGKFAYSLPIPAAALAIIARENGSAPAAAAQPVPAASPAAPVPAPAVPAPAATATKTGAQRKTRPRPPRAPRP